MFVMVQWKREAEVGMCVESEVSRAKSSDVPALAVSGC